MCEVGNRTSAGKRRRRTPIWQLLPTIVRVHQCAVCQKSLLNLQQRRFWVFPILHLGAYLSSAYLLTRQTASKVSCVHDYGSTYLQRVPELFLMDVTAHLILLRYATYFCVSLRGSSGCKGIVVCARELFLGYRGGGGGGSFFPPLLFAYGETTAFAVK